MNESITKDFGIVELNKEINYDNFEYLTEIKGMLTSKGYNLSGYDICSVIKKNIDSGLEFRFKIVHWSVPTMETEPYYRVIFK